MELFECSNCGFVTKWVSEINGLCQVCLNAYSKGWHDRGKE